MNVFLFLRMCLHLCGLWVKFICVFMYVCMCLCVCVCCVSA